MSRALCTLLLVSGIIAPAAATPKTAKAPSLALEAQKMLASRYTAAGPGASVLVARDGKVLFEKGYGMASVELKTPVTPDMVFRIGSVTKQFTAAAVLLLVEDGKVDLQAPIAKYLDKTPKDWEAVTVEMLLNHTSGIPSYTSNPEFGKRFRDDFTPERLLETFVLSKPMDFKPGMDHRYNNTGYYLLGMLIEKVSGKPWDAFMKARIFEPLGMTRTRLGTETDLIPGLVAGYAKGPLPAAYLSMTQPGAAGALVSTVADLATWTFGLHGGKVLKAGSLERMFNPTKTADGKVHQYGYGIAFRKLQGRRLIGHGGGINGFVCYLEADPETKSVAVILNNTDSPKGSDDYYVRRLLSLASGKPGQELKPVNLSKEQLTRLVGRYKGDGVPRDIKLEGGKLYVQMGENPKVELTPISTSEVVAQDADVIYRFVIEGGKVIGLHRRMVEDEEGPLQKRLEGEAATKVVAVDTVAFDACAGEYELAPGFMLKFWREENTLYTQATGQSKAEIFPEDGYTYFLKVVEAKVVFVKDADGKVVGAVLHQGGRAMPAKRMK